MLLCVADQLVRCACLARLQLLLPWVFPGSRSSSGRQDSSPDRAQIGLNQKGIRIRTHPFKPSLVGPTARSPTPRW